MRLTGRISVVVLSTMIALTGGLARANSVAATIEISSTGKVTVSPNLEASPPQFLENIDKNGGVIDVTVYNQSSSTINFTWNGYGETSGGSIISGIMTKAQDYTSFPANMTCAHSFNVAANSSSAGRWIYLSIQNLSKGVNVLISGYQRGLTYDVTYKPGANSNGNQVTATKYYGFALTLEEAIFTRQGYVQTGWATSDGGSKVYDLGGSYVANAAVTLYPVWTPHEATSYGLFVGIDEYDASKWQSLGLIVPNLLGCVVDAKSMKMTCLDYGDWQEDNVELFINGNVTVSQYRSKITSLASKAVAGDTVLIYHSGHGGNDPSSPKDAYLATYNGKYGDSDFAEDLGKFSTGVKIVVILDTCHSAGMFKGMAKDSLNFSRHTSLFVENVCAFLDSAHTKSATDRGTIQSSEIGWIAAADYDQTSAEVWANTSGGMGWFTGFMLVDGGVLNNMGDENDDGYMTFKELYSMISKLSVTLTDAVGLTQVVQAKNLDVLESVRLRSKYVDLNAAADNNVLSFSSMDDVGVHYWVGQNVGGNAHDGEDVLRSVVLPNYWDAELGCEVEGAGELSFWWRVSSEQGYDKLMLVVDGSTNRVISGETQWAKIDIELEAGTHAIQWIYHKDGSTSVGDDCGWVDQVEWTPKATKKIVKISKPAVKQLVYTGKIQFGVEYDSRLRVTGTTGATNVRKDPEISVFELPQETDTEIYQWEDGTTDPIYRTWRIEPRDVADETVIFDKIPDQTYAGEALTPPVKMTYADVVYEQEVAYTLSYSDNDKVGTGHVTVTGKGNFTGARVLDFTILGTQNSDYLYMIDKNGEAVITNYTGKGGDVVIPSTLGNIRVASIGEKAFYECSGLTSVTIQEGVGSIGFRAFEDCTTLRSVTIPSSVSSINACAFEGCSGLEDVILREGVKSIGFNAFEGCIALETLSIPSSVTSIGEYAFYGCSGLKEISVADGNVAYSSTDGILYDKNKTRLMVCPQSKIGVVTLPSSVKQIDNYAFNSCDGLTEVLMPSSVTNIGKFAFNSCDGLTEIQIPTSVTSIGDCAFLGCSGLKTLMIPPGVTSIGTEPFGLCMALTEIAVSIENRVYCSVDGVLYDMGNSALIQCPAGKSGVVLIPDGAKSIEDSAFVFCNGLTSVSIPLGVTNVADSAFSYCSALTEVSIPSSVTRIGSRAFSSCYKLKTVYVDVGDESRVRDLLTGSGLNCSDITFVVVKRIVEIDKPTAVSGLVYTGTQQSGIGALDSRLERSGNVVGTDAGNYGATFTLPADAETETFVWSDGSTAAVEVEWEILPRVVSDGLVTFAAIPEQTYAGSAITPTITMTFGGVVRSLGTDYTVTYSDNAAVGTGHATVTGIGNFTGQKVLDFEIVSHSVEHPMPDDWVKPQRKQNWQLITARVYDKTTESYLEHDEARMAAFDANGNCYGVDQIEDIDGEGDYLFMLNVGFDGNSAAGLTLKYWDPVLGVLDIAADITVYANEDIGDIINPVIYEIGDVEVTATIGQGYTWVSFPVVPEDASFDSVFAGCAFNAGDKIQTDGYSVQYSTKGTWVPASYKVVPGAMYVVKKTTAGDASITVTGSEMEKELAVGNGYNWLGCLSVNEIPLANLVHSAGFADGDKIQAQGASAQYVSKTGAWTKQISALVPGLGYKVKLANAGRLSVTSDRSFNSIVTANAVSKEVLSGVKSNVASPNWTKPSRCLNWQVITARVYDKTSGKYLENPDALLAAFDSDGVCYGVDKIEDVGDGEYMFMLNVGFNSNNVSGLTLKYWDPEIEEVVVATGVGLEANEDIGNVVSPVIYERAAAEPIPPLPLNPTVDDVKNALEGSADAHLQECITEPAEYNAYRRWAEIVKAPGGSTAAGAQAVKDSPNVWLSYALDAETLIQTPPADGDVKVEKFEQTATAGSFDFTVGVENIPVGDDAKPGNLAKVFGIEGGSTLTPQDMSSDKVDITFGTPENGKVKFTAGPKDKTLPTFFMKVKIK